jgi:hypothetical protein
MRAIRALEPAPDDPAAARTPQPTWNLTAGLVFAVGVLLAVIAGSVAAGAQFKHWQFNQFQPIQQNLDRFVEEIDTATPTQLFEEWNASLEYGLGEHMASPFVRAQANARFFAGARNIALLVCAVGIATAFSSAFLRGAKRPG